LAREVRGFGYEVENQRNAKGVDHGFEIKGVSKDVQERYSQRGESINYVVALNHGLKQLHGGFPLSLRLIREIPEVLQAKGRGSHPLPIKFRKSQNWIGRSRPGNAAYVPPPPEYVMDCLGDL
jgi:Fic family protein